ncbi:betaine/proline/choline family ABC transporter ATP-binding protein [Paenibacillus antri]|uniref:Quaternary amine transport ATP-binding protein n=1 Tax=Paenibacillus antri TaxID=2582848 RepID=A0A5R9G0W5_9BACL|nr:betaine/proline/choline family ABC transporter ATP-binding protein [Paenibacillus antri]TLS49967.1 betaine/proline/choline family ABC transporter ATP-binding protein [Paenibacillus antri]
MITLEHVNKVYDDGFKALQDIELQFREGDLNVLIGPSGCGKTTTMKLINRLIRPTSGKISVAGKDISAIDPVTLRRSIGYVIQSIGLFPHMTIAANVAVVPKLLKWDAKKTERRVDELLELVGLDPDTYRNRYPSELSGGQQQRIGVIRALAAEPDIILMDEPFSALDPISREQLQDELVRLQQELRKTIVFVTHDMDEAIKIADHIVLMKDGRVVQQGSPEAILRRPANEFVSSFVGKKRLLGQDFSDIPTVDDVMTTQPVTAQPTKGLAEAVKIMQNKRVDSLLVVDQWKKLRGTVTVYSVLEHYRDETKTLAELARPFPHVLPSGTPLSEALRIMTEHQAPYVAVADREGRFLGMVTRGSVVKHLADVYPTEGA